MHNTQIYGMSSTNDIKSFIAALDTLCCQHKWIHKTAAAIAQVATDLGRVMQAIKIVQQRSIMIHPTKQSPAAGWNSGIEA